MSKIAFFIFCIAAALQANTGTHPSIFVPMDGRISVIQLLNRYPEILWLGDLDVRYTKEGTPSTSDSYSEQFFGQKFVEFDRTLMTLQCLKHILNGSDAAYEAFSALQPADLRLSRESFTSLHKEATMLSKSGWRGLSEDQMIQAMETSLVLGDMGKSGKAREFFRPYGIEAPDHDDFHGAAMQVLKEHPELSPSFARLPPQSKELLIRTANLAHFGHVTHLEGSSDMLSALKESDLALTDPTMLAFDLFIHTCDVAGALGHVTHETALMYTEPTYKAVQATKEAIWELADPAKSEMDVYNHYLATRASWLGLDPNDRSDRVLARIGAMMRLMNPEEGLILEQAMNQFDSAVRFRLTEQLDSKNNLRTPTYAPAVLLNLLNNIALGASKEERLKQAILIGLPFIAKALELHKSLVVSGGIDPAIPLCFNAAAGIAKTTPERLNGEFTIDRDGNVNF